VYTRGEGEHTLVFLSGHGTCCPVIDFKPLWSRLVDDYRIAVVERAGYGWSRQTMAPRDIDTILAETRSALHAAGIDGPFVLAAHSIAGLEALYWAKKHPEEVSAVIGLDPAVPAVYSDARQFDSQIRKLKAMRLLLNSGVSRFMDRSALEKSIPLLSSDALNEDDKQALIAMFHAGAITRNMIEEVSYIHESASYVAAAGKPEHIPVCLFISNGEQVSIENWKEHLVDYFYEFDHKELHHLDCGHYVHHEMADGITAHMRRFLSSL
jgi:pimeloyl-ACP methyl ester carboxylesterase